MSLLIFLAALAVSIALQRQAARHRRELALSANKLGVILAPRMPKVRALEAVLGIDIGCIVAGFGAMQVWMITSVLPLIPGNGSAADTTSFNSWASASLTLSAGLALLYLGGKALLENIRFKRSKKNLLSASPAIRSEARRSD
ncbi:MAG TPA: hypothetical protein VEO56_07055 [Bacteroidota bacterium]|nr:hypothetical protein [Bacteroidota bacterium]